jgi:hypothetical protein
MTLKKFVLSAFLFCSVAGAMAVPVTFQVNMGYQTGQGAFDPTNPDNKVEVRGSFNDWSGGFALAPSATDPNLYIGTTEVAGTTGSTIEFKFVNLNGATANWETSNNRSFALSSEAQTLPVAFFNNEWDGAPLNVTFQVNMATQIAAHAFDPAADSVNLRGEFNTWGMTPMAPDPSNPDVYVATVEVPQAPGSQVQYKFHIARAAGGETWENDPNRAFAQKDTDQTLPVVYFNNVTGIPVKAQLNVAVDLSAQILNGTFDPNAQEVYLRGNKVGWDVPPQGLKLQADASRSGSYTNVLVMDNALTGDVVEFKFTIWDPTLGTTIWEDGANKSVTFTGSEPNIGGYLTKTYGPAFFNGINPADLLSEDTLVTFHVDMNGATRMGGAAFDPVNDSVFINGTFVANGSWGPWGTMDATWLMFDDGATSGDTTDNDGIYTIQVNIPRGSPARLTYKYGINSEDNEAAAGNDHVRYVRATGAYTMPLDKFGSPTQETQNPEVGGLNIARAANNHFTITWTAQPGLKLQRVDLTTGAKTDVPGTDGQSSIDLVADQSAAFYQLVKP